MGWNGGGKEKPHSLQDMDLYYWIFYFVGVVVYCFCLSIFGAC